MRAHDDRPPAGRRCGPLGFVPRASAPGTATWEYTVEPAHFNPNGVLHGGVLMALLDTAMGHAVAGLVAPGGAFNAAAQMNMHSSSRSERRDHARAPRSSKCGKRLAVVEAEATDEHGARARHRHLHARHASERKPEPPRVARGVIRDHAVDAHPAAGASAAGSSTVQTLTM